MFLQLYFYIFVTNLILCEEFKINNDLVTNSSGNIEGSNEFNITSSNENLDLVIERDEGIEKFYSNEYAEDESQAQMSGNLDNQNEFNIENNEISDNFHQENAIKNSNSQQDDNQSFRDYLINLMNFDENVTLKENSLLLNIAEAEGVNTTVANLTASNNTTSKKCFCIDLDNKEQIGDVEIINSTILQSLLIHDANISSRSVPARCYLIYFFSPFCPFSTQGSAYVNALARSLKNIPIYGLDSIMFHSMNARYGVMGTPSLILFHNGNVIARYNASEYSTFNLEAFIQHFSNQVAESINVTSHDFKALLPSKVIASSLFALYISWVFLITCGGWLFFNSEFYAKLKEAVLNNWREAEAQHAHDD